MPRLSICWEIRPPIIIITITFSLVALPNENKVDPRRVKRATTIQSRCKKKMKHMQECFPKQLRMRTADKERKGEGKQKRVKM